MHLLDPQLLGAILLSLLAVIVVIKRKATGSIFDLPRGRSLVLVVNSFNLFFLLIAIPAVSVLLITGSLEDVDPIRVTIAEPWMPAAVEATGLILYIIGHFLMGSALISLGGNYQLGGIRPRAADKMVLKGPFKVIRHPMYSAALSISLGLACLTQSCIVFGIFVLYLLLINLLIPLEEDGLMRVYKEQYASYRFRVKKLVPFVY
jgi:protein-S-isoprenylcysteine O-methyltransferase Ste14